MSRIETSAFGQPKGDGGGACLMRKWLVIVSLLCGLALLIQKPKYWKIFQQDTQNYNTITFYWIIKEEYKNSSQQFTNIEDGDILVTDSTYCFCYRHGHAALVVDAAKGLTLEAYGIGTESKYSKISEWKRYPHVKVLRLQAPKEVRKAIAVYARNNLDGIPYRLSSGMIDDKDMKGEYWGTQCAHLVWLAFKKYGYDIDGDGGWLVTPADFIKSELVIVVPQGE